MKHLFFGGFIFLSTATQAQHNKPLNSADSVILAQKTEREAAFPGGNEAWQNFLMATLKPDNAIDAVPKRKKKYTVTAIVKFVVRYDGTITEIAVENKVHPDIEAEAIRVIKKSPTWIPAIQHGYYVNAYRRQPLTFTFN